MGNTAIAAEANDAAARVIILANAADADSVRLARYYASKRVVPPENIIALPMPEAETIEWPEFVSTIWNPLQDELVRRGWIDAVTMGTNDETGRRRRAPHGHRIAYLVICRGVPLRINNSPALYRVRMPGLDRAEVRTNQAAVDSELAQLALGTPPINGFIDNPLFNNSPPDRLDQEKVVKTGRLDGPTYESAQALVDNALLAEREGIRGRAYVDIGGIHPDGERWLEAAVVELEAAKIPHDVDRQPTMIPATARFDAPLFYFGWYSAAIGGPFVLPGFKFPPGAVAVSIHSTSAQSVRSTSEGWTGPFVARGVTATVGNVFEPYLQFTHRPSLLLRGLVKGMNFGDAAAYAMPVLGWQSIAVGDPLYRPFAKPYNPEPTSRLARGLETGDLAFAADVREIPADQWGLARLAAVRLAELGDAPRALAVYKNLFAIAEVTRELRMAWLPEAIATARAAGDTAQVAGWEKDLNRE